MDMPEPVGPICELVHPLFRGDTSITEAARTISGTNKCSTVGDWVAAERCLLVVEMVLAVGCPAGLRSYPGATTETELGEAESCPVVLFEAAKHVLPSFLYMDPDTKKVSERQNSNS